MWPINTWILGQHLRRSRWWSGRVAESQGLKSTLHSQKGILAWNNPPLGSFLLLICRKLEYLKFGGRCKQSKQCCALVLSCCIFPVLCTVKKLARRPLYWRAALDNCCIKNEALPPKLQGQIYNFHVMFYTCGSKPDAFQTKWGSFQMLLIGSRGVRKCVFSCSCSCCTVYICVTPCK